MTVLVPRILRIDGSTRHSGSVSRDLTDLAISTLQNHLGGANVTQRDTRSGIGHISSAWRNASLTPNEARSSDGAAAPEVTPAETFQADARVEPAPDPVPDDTPIDANEARLQQLEAELDERIRTEEAEGRLKEEDATELAYIDEEVKEQELYHQAVFEVTECLIKNG